MLYVLLRIVIIHVYNFNNWDSKVNNVSLKVRGKKKTNVILFEWILLRLYVYKWIVCLCIVCVCAVIFHQVIPSPEFYRNQCSGGTRRPTTAISQWRVTVWLALWRPATPSGVFGELDLNLAKIQQILTRM